MQQMDHICIHLRAETHAKKHKLLPLIKTTVCYRGGTAKVGFGAAMEQKMYALEQMWSTNVIILEQ